jgi:hypothetical protein
VTCRATDLRCKPATSNASRIRSPGALSRHLLLPRDIPSSFPSAVLWQTIVHMQCTNGQPYGDGKRNQGRRTKARFSLTLGCHETGSDTCVHRTRFNYCNKKKRKGTNKDRPPSNTQDLKRTPHGPIRSTTTTHTISHSNTIKRPSMKIIRKRDTTTRLTVSKHITCSQSVPYSSKKRATTYIQQFQFWVLRTRLL